MKKEELGRRLVERRKLLAENELTGVRRVFEIKRKRKMIDLTRVREKFAAFVRASGEWQRVQPDFAALSMEDM